jgi:CHASE3 domain sensor protein
MPLSRNQKLQYIQIVLESDDVEQILIDVAIQFLKEIQEEENEGSRNDR